MILWRHSLYVRSFAPQPAPPPNVVVFDMFVSLRARFLCVVLGRLQEHGRFPSGPSAGG